MRLLNPSALLVSLMLAAALRPSADYLTSRGLPVSLAWLLVYLGLFVAVGLALFLLGGRLLDELRLLSNYLVILYDYTYQRWDNSDSGVAQAIIQRLPPPDQLPEVMAVGVRLGRRRERDSMGTP